MNLTEYVKQVSREDFKKEFMHVAVWNTRLRSTGGRFFPKDGHLDFNPKVYAEQGLEIFRKIVRHELCHYHLYFEKKGYKHGDRDFQELLTRVDGLRYTPRSNYSSEKLHYYRCKTCSRLYQRRRRFDVRKYRCSNCHGSLIYQES